MRTLASSFRTAIESSNSSEAVFIFATITHPNLLRPIYVNSDIKDYILGGNTYLGTAMSVSLLSDQINAPSAKISIPNVDRAIGETVLNLRTSPTIKLEVYARSDFDDLIPDFSAYDFGPDFDIWGSRTRVAIGIPTVEYSAPLLFLRNVTCDALGFTADLNSYDLSSEPWPAIRSTKNRLPGLYR